MAEEVQQIKNQIWFAKQKIEAVEKERNEYVQQIKVTREVLEAAPDNAEVRAVQAELQEGLAEKNAALEPLLEHLATLEAKLPRAPVPVVPKFDPEKHPLLKKAMDKAEVAKPVVFNTGDICEAVWYQDKLWYKAKILSILGSASSPRYHVRFLDYDTTVTVDRDAVRPLQNKRKREADATPASAANPSSQITPVTSTPHIISGPVSVNPNAQVAKKDVESETMEPKKRHKIPNQKALEKGVNNWKNWNSKGVGKKLAQKESMFRSGTTVNSRVGFTGSGAGMTETHKRVRHNKNAEAEAEANGQVGGSVPKRRSRF